MHRNTLAVLAMLLAACQSSTSPEPGVTGTWEGTLTELVVDGPAPMVGSIAFSLVEADGQVAGSGTSGQRTLTVSGARSGDMVTLVAAFPEGRLEISAQWDGDTMSGSVAERLHEWPEGLVVPYRMELTRR